MGNRLFATVCALGVASLFAVLGAVQAAEPTARELIDRLPVLKDSDQSLKTVDISLFHQHDGKLGSSYRFLYRAPDRFAYLLADSRGTPDLFTADHQTLMYDPVYPQFILIPRAAASFRFGVVDGKEVNKIGGKPEQLLFDIKSLFEALDAPGSPEPQVVKLGEQQYLLIRQAGKFFRRARLDLSKPMPLVSYEISNTPRGAPFLCIDRIAVNQPLDDALLAFPTEKQVTAILPVLTLSTNLGVSQLFGGMAAANRATYVHSRIQKPAFCTTASSACSR